MVSTAFKLESYKIPLTGPYCPYISFVGKIYSKPRQDDNDCIVEINVNEYNNFNFTDKGRIYFKVQVVYDAGSDSRFKKLTPKLEVRKMIFITGLLDLSNDDLPFIEAKEIDLLEDSAAVADDRLNTNSQSLFLRIQKFKIKNTFIKKEKSSDNTNEKANQYTKNSDDEDEEEILEHDKKIQTSKRVKNLDKGKNTVKNDKRKKELEDSQPLKKIKL